MKKEMKTPYRGRFATFNVGDFTGRGFEAGSEEAKRIIRQTMDSVHAELWALQEDVGFFGEQTGQDPYEAIYNDYQNYERRGNSRYNYKAFLSDFEIKDVEQVRYIGALTFRHPWFLHGTVTLGEREVCLINLHFDWSDKVVRGEQITQVLDFASKHEYCVIMGDFNPEDYIDGNRQSTRLLYEEELSRFIDAGYCLANGGAFGTFDTILDTQVSPCPFDNIIVSSNITISAAGRVADPWMADHAIIWADLEME